MLARTPSIETEADTATCLPPLKSLFTTVSNFFSNLSRTRRFSSSRSSASLQDEAEKPAHSSPYPQSYGTPTFLSLPRPIPTRFHDHTSDLDYDPYELPPPPVTRPHAHSRTPSAITMFTNITRNFTIPPFDREVEAALPRSRIGRSMIELDAYATRGRYAVSSTSKSGSGSGSGDTYVGSEENKTIRRVGSEGSSFAHWKGGKRVHVNMMGRVHP